MEWINTEGDIDYSIYESRLKGRITKARWKLIHTYTRKKSGSRGHCGHDYDCCGCVSSEYYEIKFDNKDKSILLIHKINFNY